MAQWGIGLALKLTFQDTTFIARFYRSCSYVNIFECNCLLGTMGHNHRALLMLPEHAARRKRCTVVRQAAPSGLTRQPDARHAYFHCLNLHSQLAAWQTRQPDLSVCLAHPMRLATSLLTPTTLLGDGADAERSKVLSEHRRTEPQLHSISAIHSPTGSESHPRV